VDAINVRANGLSELISRAEEFQRIQGFFQVLANLGPQLAGVVLSRLNLDAILKRVVRALGFNEKDILVPSPAPGAALTPLAVPPAGESSARTPTQLIFPSPQEGATAAQVGRIEEQLLGGE
jgi:hypothetical protein